MNKKKKHSSQKSSAPLEEKGYMGFVKGIAGGLIVTVIAFVLLAVILTYTSMSEGLISASSVIITAIAAIVAGFFAARSANSRGMLWGMLAGLFYVIIIFMIMFSSQKEVAFTLGKITGIISALAGGGIGGILGINAKK